MDNKKEIQLRCDKAIDFIYNSIKNGRLEPRYESRHPVDYDKCSIELQLKTVSLLDFYADLTGKKYLSIAAKQILDKVMEYRFNHTEFSCLIQNNKSFTVWQVYIASILFKRKMFRDAVAFMESLRHSIKGSYIEGFFAPGTDDSIINKTSRLESPLGIIALSFLLGHRYFDNIKYDEMAKFICDMIMSKGRFDALDIWTTRFIYDMYNEQKYSDYADAIITRINSVSVLSMSSLVAAMSLKSNLAWIDKYPKYNDRVNELITYQISLQNMQTGAFKRSTNNDDIKLEYTVYNVIALLLYLNRIEHEKMDILKLLT